MRALTAAALLAWVAALLYALHRHSPWGERLLVWPAALGLALVPLLIVLETSGLVRVFGPVLYFDLVRQARRTRYTIIRILYACGLFGMLLWVYWMWQLDYRYRGIPTSKLPEFAQSFFYTFVGVQTLLVLALTPAYTAGAVTDEKESKTLQFLLATDLHDREIILSKLTSRVINIVLAVLVGLPILSCLQFIGGIDPSLLLASFAATAAVVFSLASLSLFNSTLLKRSRDAIVLSYLIPPIYVLVSGVSQALLAGLDLEVLYWPGTFDQPSGLSLLSLVQAFSAGDPVMAIQAAESSISGTPGPAGTGAPTLGELTLNFCLFHGYLGMAFVGGSLFMLRRRALKEASETVRKRFHWPRPAVGNLPLVWKEVFAERGVSLHLLAWLALIGLVLLSFLPAYYILDEYFTRPTTWSGAPPGWRERHMRQEMNIIMERMIGTCVAFLLVAGVAVRAAGSITGERARQTLDTLLTAPITSNEILFGKWVGSIASVRWGVLWLGAIWFLGLVTGGLSPLAVPLLVFLWLIYAAFAGLVGLWYSMICTTTLRATLASLFTLVGLAFGHWLIWMCCGPLIAFGGGPGRGDGLEVLLKFQAGLTPPISMGLVAFHHDSNLNDEVMEMMGYGLAGAIVWVIALAGLWALASERFALLTRRSRESLMPERRRLTRRPQPRPDADEED